MLPVSDRILLKLRESSKSVPQLSSELRVDSAVLWRVLRALEADGIVDEVPQVNEAARWRLAPGVTVTFRPAEVIVEGATPRYSVLPELPACRPCRATTCRGTPCKFQAVAGDLCYFHLQRVRDGAEAGDD